MTRSVGLLLYVIPQRIVSFFVQEREQEYEESLAQNAEKIVSNRISPTNAVEGYAYSRLSTVPYFFLYDRQDRAVTGKGAHLGLICTEGPGVGVYGSRGREARK